MWSAERHQRKTHVWLDDQDPATTPICKLRGAGGFLWDADLATETPAELVKRIERTDADEIVCRSCLRALKSMP